MVMDRKEADAANPSKLSKRFHSLADPDNRRRVLRFAILRGCAIVPAASILLLSKYIVDLQKNVEILTFMVMNTLAIALLAWQLFEVLQEHRCLCISITALAQDQRARVDELTRSLTQHIEELVDRDPVTGLLNQRATIQCVEQELKRARRTGQQFSIVLMDIDGFKLFNDTYGLASGDQVLKRIASLLQQQGRGSDPLGRYGGDGFVVILPNTGVEGALALAERLRSSLATSPYVTRDGLEIPLRMSFGISTYPDNGRKVNELMEFADANLIQSKRKGGDTITVEDNFGLDLGASDGTFSVLDGLITAVDHKDHYTRKHSEDVTNYSLAIGRAMGLSEEQLQTLRIAGLLHDVGKIAVPDRILQKPGRLDAEEFEIIKQHVVLGELIIKDVPNISEVLAAVGSHHERIDGSGYPRGLKGDEIPILGRILAVADAYSAMTTSRPYHLAMEPKEAQAELLRVAGVQLDGNVVEAFLKVLETGIIESDTVPIRLQAGNWNGRATSLSPTISTVQGRAARFLRSG
jgi:diguanylate cyclase (GGDEF)-like protein